MPEKFNFFKPEDQKKIEDSIKEKIEKPREVKPDNFDSDPEEESEKDKKRKTIEIPGMGKIEYYEKMVMFPEKIVRETGGVKGYIRKTIKTEELINKLFHGKIDPETIKKALDTKREYLKSERKGPLTLETTFKTEKKEEDEIINKYIYGYGSDRKGEAGLDLEENTNLRSIALKLTDGNFPNETFNHAFFAIHGTGRKEESDTQLVKDKVLLQKIFNPVESFHFKKEQKIPEGYIVGENDKIIFQTNEFVPAWNKEKIEKEKLNDILAIFSNAGKQIKKYYISIDGLSVSCKGRHWGYSNIFDNNHFGFNRKNKVFSEYLKNSNELLHKINNNNPKTIDSEDFSYSRDSIEIINSGSRWSPYSKIYDHPMIPIVIGNPTVDDKEIPELRWCHASYASILTKKGWNIIEIIT